MHSIVEDHRTWATSEEARLPLGFGPFDRRAGGMAPGEFALFLARPSVGKTVWACNVIMRTKHVPTVFFSLEMDARFIAQRIAAMTYGVPTLTIEQEMKTHGTSRFMDALERDYPLLWIEDDPATSLRGIKNTLEEVPEYTEGQPCRLALVDHLELVKGGRSLEAQGNVAAVANGLKVIARESKASLIALQQVARGDKNAGDQPLSLVSGRYGGEDAADYLLGAYRPALKHGIAQDEYEALKSHFYLQYLKTRSGGEIRPTGALYEMTDTMRLMAWDDEAKGQNHGSATTILEAPPRTREGGADGNEGPTPGGGAGLVYEGS